MSKKNSFLVLIFSLLFILGIAGSYWFYFLNKKKDVWSLIPNTSIAVYEINQIDAETWEKYKKSTFWKNILFSNEAQKLETKILTILKNVENQELLKSSNFHISTHKLNKEELGFIFYFEIPKELTENFKKQVNNLLDNNTRHEKRLYEKVTIHDLSFEQNKTNFSYFLEENVLVLSFSSVLLEDAIRSYRDKISNFKTENNIRPLKKASHDKSNLYINMRKIKEILACFSDTNSPLLNDLANSLYLDLRISNQRLFGNGTLNTNKGYLSAFKKQKKTSFNVSNLISIKSSSLFRIGISDMKALHQNLRKINQVPEIETNFSWIGKEVALAKTEGLHSGSEISTLYILIKDKAQADNFLTSLSNASDFELEFEKQSIKQVSLNEIPSKYFGKPFSGFNTTYYTYIGSYLIMSPDLNTLKDNISDIHKEDTWGKRSRVHNFFSQLNKKNNLLYIINMNKSNFKFKEELEVQNSIFSQITKPLEFVAFDLSHHQKNQFTISMVIEADKENVLYKKKAVYEQLATTNLENLVINKLSVFRNKTNLSQNILVQDAKFNLFKLNQNGEILWERKLEYPIIGKIKEIKLKGSSKKQYAFSSLHKLHIIEEDGKDVKGFPFTYKHISDISKFSIFDYNRNHNYRFCVSDTDGNIWLYDSKANNLKGWKPMRKEYELALGSKHLRIGKKDYIFSVLQNGNIHLNNRRGETTKGFPIQRKDNLSQGVFLKEGDKRANTNFYLLNKNGKLTVTNLNGKVLRTEQMVKESKDDQFMLCPDELNRTFLLLRFSKNKVTFFDSKAKLLFEKANFNFKNSIVQYYRFDAQNQVIILVDKEQAFTFLYDRKGKLINDFPILGDKEIRLMYFSKKNKYRLFHSLENQVLITEF